MVNRQSEAADSVIQILNDLNIYQALVDIPCSQCKELIKPGDYFSRSSTKDGSTRGFKYALCSSCIPIHFSIDEKLAAH